MELLIGILMYLGLILPGTYTTEQVNAMIFSNASAVATVQNNPTLQAAIQPNNPNTTGIIIQDPDEEEGLN